MSNIFKNTIQKGSFRTIVFKEDDVWYGVALEFNLVVDADDPQIALFKLFDAATGYVETVAKSKSRPHALNQIPEKEYSDLWKRLSGNLKLPSLYQSVYHFGYTPIQSVM